MLIAVLLLNQLLITLQWRIIAADSRIWRSLDLSHAASSHLNSPTLQDHVKRDATSLHVRNPSRLTEADLALLVKLLNDSSSLETLSLEYCVFEEPFTLALTSLHSLSLSGSTVVVDCNLYCPQLSVLDLSHCAQIDRTVALIPLHFPNLEKLSLAGCYSLSSSAIRGLLTQLPRLTSLDLRYISGIESRTVKPWISKTSQPVTLDIRHCEVFTVRDIKSLRKLAFEGSEIIHSAILCDHTEDSYRAYIDLVIGATVFAPDRHDEFYCSSLSASSATSSASSSPESCAVEWTL